MMTESMAGDLVGLGNEGSKRLLTQPLRTQMRRTLYRGVRGHKPAVGSKTLPNAERRKLRQEFLVPRVENTRCPPYSSPQDHP